MKTLPPPCPEPEVGPRYWRSLDQLADTPEFREWAEKEFPSGAGELADPVSRRHFVKIMSASFLLAGLGMTGCRRPVENIVPFARMPEGYAHGVPQFYATARPTRSGAVPLVVKSHDGRPVKVEGNPHHPDSNGGTDAFTQASLLDLYDPDRATRFGKGGRGVSRLEALDFLGQLARQAQETKGRGVSFLLGRGQSPSRDRVIAALRKQLPQARWFVHEPVDFDVHRQAATLAFGKPVRPCFKFEAAKIILSLDADFLGAEEDCHVHIRRFAQGRRLTKPTDTMNRLYAVEALLTVTGANADHRLRVPAAGVLRVAGRLAAEVLAGAGVPAGQMGGFLPAVERAGQGAPGDERWIAECAKDLLAHKGEVLVVAGQRQPLAVHVIAHALNAALGAAGKSVVLLAAPEPTEGSLADLAKSLNAGEVETLVIVGGNPVYDAPADLDWAATQRKAKTVIRLGYHEDETAAISDWHFAQAHYLESWGDARTADGTLVAIQPLIEPLFGGISELEFLARIGGLEQTNPHAIVRETFRGLAGGGADEWQRFLHDGFQPGTAAKPVEAGFNWTAAAGAFAVAAPPPLPTRENLEVIFHRDYSVDDGRFNNNGWLQETPDPVTKLTWDNAVLMSVNTARDLGLGRDLDPRGTHKPEKGKFKTRVIEIELDGRTLRGPVWIVPGMADHTLGLALGYGREKAGRIGGLQDGRPAGFNAYSLRTTAAPHFAVGAKVTLTSQRYLLACTQEHGVMEGRPIIREANKSQFEAHPDFAKNFDLDSPGHTRHIPMDPDRPDRPKSIYPRPALDGMHQWGMSIDLTACVGCTACAVACQSENNIPIVGKEQVTRGREMSWLRIDRYFAGTVQDPQVANQPMLCQHCENAPCENVCPVNATVHDSEGLNVMVYNRCVGTRYCSNNCPYKVRRFNYFDYNRRPLDGLYKSPFSRNKDGRFELFRWFMDPDRGTRAEDEWELLKLVRNPDVSVRMRGVMEKCTFCIQRIEQAKIAQKVKAGPSGDVRVPDGADSKDPTALKTACQQACPAEAIVFGDVSDPNSRVSQLKRRQHDYKVLNYLDTQPRTSYLARIRNPNPAMPDYHEYPQVVAEYKKKTHSDPFEVHGAHDPGHAPAGATKKGAH